MEAQFDSNSCAGRSGECYRLAPAIFFRNENKPTGGQFLDGIGYCPCRQPGTTGQVGLRARPGHDGVENLETTLVFSAFCPQEIAQVNWQRPTPLPEDCNSSTRWIDPSMEGFDP